MKVGICFADIVKLDDDFFLKSTPGHFGTSYLIPIGNHRLTRWSFFLDITTPFGLNSTRPKASSHHLNHP